jgi:A/G-specific adenine glycosylase
MPPRPMQHDDPRASLVEALLQWFAVSQRPLPWRGRYDPYAVWISEIMLQQTQMERGVAYFERWMRKYPTIAHVARAPLDDILKTWEGLGYYNRARNLHKAARRVMEHHGGVFPQAPDAIRALPGVGDYTAGAIASIAYNLDVPAVDANVCRVFARLFDIDEPVDSPAAHDYIRRMAAGLLPLGRAREYNQALMELGALVCGKVARCSLCPVRRFCRAERLGIVRERPVPGKKIPYAALEIVSGFLAHRGRVFVQKRPESGVWAGFWEFPGGRLEAGETPEQGVAREFMEETEFPITVVQSLGIVRHAYTRYRIAMHCFACRLADCAEPAEWPVPTLHAATAYHWATLEEVEHLTLPAGHRKFTDAYLPLLQRFMETE